MDDHQLTFSISYESWDILGRCIPHGIRGAVCKALVEGFVEKLQQDPARVLAHVIARQWKLGEFFTIPANGKEDL